MRWDLHSLAQWCCLEIRTQVGLVVGERSKQVAGGAAGGLVVKHRWVAQPARMESLASDVLQWGWDSRWGLG